jgi:hypothetical protein
MEPLTEHRPVHGPVVYGYLRLTKAADAWHTALAETLAEYCRQHELRMCGVFTERGTSAQAPSAAFVALLDVLALPETYGVVVPAISHLGRKTTADERQKQITAAGARLLLVRGPSRLRPAGPRPALAAEQPGP